MDPKVLDRYNSAEGATDYLGKFKRRWTERVNDRNEQKVLRGLIRSAGIEKVPGLALDLPCGYGRLYPVWLALLFSGHRYAVLRRVAPA